MMVISNPNNSFTVREKGDFQYIKSVFLNMMEKERVMGGPGDA